jgi:Zn-finger domain-containing protein
MGLPFNIRIGHVALKISPGESNPTKTISEDQIWTEISTSWRAVKEFADKFVEDHELQHSLDPFHKNPKVKLMKMIFESLKDPLIEKKTFIEELVKTGKFSEEDAKSHIDAAVIHGMFEQIKDGYYVK